MSKYVKELIQKEFEKKIENENINDFLVVNMTSVGGTDNNMLREQLRQEGIKLTVVRNSLFKKALSSRKMDQATPLFSGPCTIAYGADSIVDVAKQLSQWRKKIPTIEIKGAFLDGKALFGKQAENLAMMLSRPQLQAEIISMAQSPAKRISALLASPASLVASFIKTLAEREEAA